jgi:hypothetical protein
MNNACAVSTLWLIVAVNVIGLVVAGCIPDFRMMAIPSFTLLFTIVGLIESSKDESRQEQRNDAIAHPSPVPVPVPELTAAAEA